MAKKNSDQAASIINSTPRQAYQSIPGGGFFRFLAIVALGSTLLTSPSSRFNGLNIVFGILIFLIFIKLYRVFLKSFLGLFNPAVKKSSGKEVIKQVVNNSLLYLLPFALMSVLATYVFNWSISNAFISTGIMAVGTAASIEIEKLRDKRSLKNTFVTSGVSLLFSFGLTIGFQYLVRIPGLLDGLIGLIPTLLGKGGGLQ